MKGVLIESYRASLGGAQAIDVLEAMWITTTALLAVIHIEAACLQCAAVCRCVC